jgi:hypothetical protein
MHPTDFPRDRRVPRASPRPARPAVRALRRSRTDPPASSPRVRSWSGDVCKLSIDERRPRPVVSGKFFADEDDSGRRSWEAFVTLVGGLEELDVDRECMVVFELENGQRVRGRAVTQPEQADTPEGDERYLFVGTGALAPFDWSLLDDS